MSKLSDFYTEVGPTEAGYWLTDIWCWQDDQLEEVHNYIQWLFPLQEASRFNPDAPLLTDDDIAVIDKDDVRRSFQTMCDFYGIEYQVSSITKCPTTWAHKGSRWVTRGNHNFLRLTRIIKSLMLFGLESEAITLEMFLSGLYENDPGHFLIVDGTADFWREAASNG